MIDRTTIDSMVDGKSVMLTIDEQDGEVASISSPHGNHVIEPLVPGKWLIRDAAALDGSLAILEQGWMVRPVTDDERSSWTHHGRVFAGAQAPVSVPPPQPALPDRDTNVYRSLLFPSVGDTT